MSARIAVTVLLLPLVGLQMGCGGEDAPAPSSGGTSGTFNVSIPTVDESGVQGLATLSPGQDVTVKLELMGLESGNTYGASVLSGTCDSPGEEVIELNEATAGAIGIGSSVTPVSPADLEGGGSYHIKAYLPDGTVAACGDIPSESLAGL